jgi:hypothetical protein
MGYEDLWQILALSHNKNESATSCACVTMGTWTYNGRLNLELSIRGKE